MRMKTTVWPDCFVVILALSLLSIWEYPMHFSKLRREDIQPVVDKLINRIAGWRGKLLSTAGKLTLLKSCLASIPIYLLSVIKFPKWAIESINSQMGELSLE